MYYEEKFENGQWYRRGTPNGEWEPFDRDKEILAALDGAIRVLRRYTIHVGDEADTARGGLHNARPALKRMVERLEKLEAVAEAAGKYRDACEDFEHMCERAVEEGWGDDPTGSTHVSCAADRELRSLAALDAALEALDA